MFSVNPKCSPSMLANFRDSVKDLHLLRSLNDVETSIRISCRAHTLGRSPPPHSVTGCHLQKIQKKIKVH